jgi:hypothetical protein
VTDGLEDHLVARDDDPSRRHEYDANRRPGDDSDFPTRDRARAGRQLNGVRGRSCSTPSTSRSTRSL